MGKEDYSIQLFLQTRIRSDPAGAGSSGYICLDLPKPSSHSKSCRPNSSTHLRIMPVMLPMPAGGF